MGGTDNVYRTPTWKIAAKKHWMVIGCIAVILGIVGSIMTFWATLRDTSASAV